MNFRIEKMDSFQIMGLAGYYTPAEEWKDSLWGQFLDGGDGVNGSGTFNQALWNNGNPSYYTSPFWQIGATDFHSVDGRTPYIRNESIPMLDCYPGGKIDDDYSWAIWMPILDK